MGTENTAILKKIPIKLGFLGLVLAASCFALFIAPGRLPATGQADDFPSYVGSEKCRDCHQIHYKGWVKTFHSTIVQDARKHPEAILGDFSEPGLPFTKEDVWFTIGGHWDQRYLTKIDDDFYVLPRLWSVQSKKWRPYSTWAWKKRPYSKFCAGCHSVAYDPKRKAYAEHTIGCEACHGEGKMHTEKPGRENIVNPSRLPRDRGDMICASCHVRGKDSTGEYFYPVGYKPGEDLSKFMVPLEKEEGETVLASILRLWEKWKGDREDQARSRCEVCGIHQPKKQQSERKDVSGMCMGCHEFGEGLAKHTRHDPEVEISCTACHKQKVNPMDNKEENVHSYSYFLVHPLNCWDEEIYNHCGSCHAEKDRDWALSVYYDWKYPRETGH